MTLFAKVIFLTLAVLLIPHVAFANHPVLVEGESDFDGDGFLGVDEDLDGDRIFGTLTAALAADLGAVNQNGTIMIVTSGRFPEGLLIIGANGNVTIEAAPGVVATIDAVLAGRFGKVERQNAPGIVIDAPASRRITLRNLVIRNWRDGVIVLGESHLRVSDCKVEHSLNYGIRVRDRARVLISDSQVSNTGFRVGAAGNAPEVDIPMPGVGIQFEADTQGMLINSQSTGNFGNGLIKKGASVQRRNFNQFDNGGAEQ